MSRSPSWPYIAEWNEARRNNAQLYNELLAGLDGIIIPQEADYVNHVYHVYAIRVQNRDVLISALTKEDIHCGMHYPVPLHLQEAYLNLGYKEADFAVSERVASEVLSLPMYPELTYDQQRTVVEKIKEFSSS